MGGITESLGPLRALKGGRAVSLPQSPVQPDVRTPAHPDVRTPAHPEARTHESTHVHAADQPDARPAARPYSRTAGQPDVREPGKRSDGAYRKRTVLLRDTTWKKAARKWQDEGNGDFSDLVEELLLKYAEGK